MIGNRLSKNSHIGCIILFVVAALAFALYSVPRLKRLGELRYEEQRHKDSAALKRAWQIADSVRREELMEDPDYVELLEKIEEQQEEIESLKDSINRLNGRLY